METNSEPKKKRTKRAELLILVIIIVYIIYAGISYFIDKSELNNKHQYTIGYVTNIKNYGKSGGLVVYFNMSIDNQTIQGSTNITKFDTAILNKRFFVMYYPLKPTNCKILLNCPVSDSLNPPKQNWEKMPSIDETKKKFNLNY